MKLTQDKKMLFNKEDLDIVQDINIYANKAAINDNYWYANTMSKSRNLVAIHRLIY